MLKILLPLLLPLLALENSFMRHLSCVMFQKNCGPVVSQKQVNDQNIAQLKRFLNHWLFVSSLNVSVISDDIHWNLWQNAIKVYYSKRKQATNLKIFVVSDVSGGSYCNRNPNSRTKAFYMITCNNFKFSRNQCLIYLLQMIKSSGLLLHSGNKCQLMILLPSQFKKRTDF